jgi:hypothetical protein
VKCFSEAFKSHEGEDFDVTGKLGRVNELVKNQEGN